MIRAARPVCDMVERIVPANVLQRLSERGEKTQVSEVRNGLWKSLLMALISQVGAYLTLSVAVILISFAVLLPLCRGAFGHWPGNTICGLLTLLAASPFLRAIVMRKNRSEEWRQLRQRGWFHRIGLWFTFGVRYAIAASAVYYVLNFLSPFWWGWHVITAMVCVLLFILSRRIKWTSIKLERTFLQNLRSREVMARVESGSGEPGYAGRLTSRNIHIAELEVPTDSAWAGGRLNELGFSHRDGVMIAAIVRGEYRLNVPDGEAMIFPGDRIEAIGDDESLQAFACRMSKEHLDLPLASSRLQLRRIIVREGSSFIGVTLRDSGIRSDYHCMVVGFEDAQGNIVPATAERTILRGDAMWIVGEDNDVRKLMKLD